MTTEDNESGFEILNYTKTGEIVETMGQEWCLCPYELGIENYFVIPTSQGSLVLCAIRKVVTGPEHGQIRRVPLTKEDLNTLPAVIH